MLPGLLAWAAFGASSLPPPTADPEGVWRSLGYGLVWRFEGDRLTTWEVTGTTCVPSTLYRRDRSDSTSLVYRADSTPGAVANDWLIRPGGTRGHFMAHTPGTLADVQFARLPSVPPRCRTPTGSSRTQVFETFVQTMTEHYAFFRERKVDWTAAVAAARKELAAAGDDRDFYRILEGMMAPLSDAHTDVTATDLKLRTRHYRTTDRSLPPAEVLRLRRLAPPGLAGPLEEWNDGRIQLAPIDDSTSYLRITLLYGYAASGRFEDDSLALEQTLAVVMPRITARPRLVLDLRLNGGGYDGLARLIASHLTERPYIALIKQARVPGPGAARFSLPASVAVPAAARDRFGGPIVVLTGIHTVSAGEVLTLMLMGRRPAPVRIGEPTQGVFADELVRRLPNGWIFQLSSERYRDPAGRVFEGPGIPPDETVPVYPPDERDGRTDRALARALERLTNGASSPGRRSR